MCVSVTPRSGRLGKRPRERAGGSAAAECSATGTTLSTRTSGSYWIEAWGGPAQYSELIGDETTVVRIRSGNGPHEEMDRRAVSCFDLALADVGLDRDDTLRQVLHDHFSWATHTTTARYHDSPEDVPEGLPIPHWSWEGLVGGN
jgi:hemoglobin